MTKADISFVKRSLKLNNNAASVLCGCVVNGDGQKICSFKENFLHVSDAEAEKYLKFAAKIFSNKLRDNVLIAPFSQNEEMHGEKYALLAELYRSILGNSDAVEEFYEKVIEDCPITGNYLILLLYNTASLETDEDDFSCDHLIGMICPLKLSADGLSYDGAEEQIANAPRVDIVSAPECGFSFPVIESHETNVHFIQLYSKKAKSPQTDFLTKLTGCNYLRTAFQKKELLANAVTTAYAENGDKYLAKLIKEICDEEDLEKVISLKEIKDALMNISENKDSADIVVNGLTECFNEEEFLASDFYDSAMIEKADAIEKKERLQILLKECVKQIEDASGENGITKEIKDEFIR